MFNPVRSVLHRLRRFTPGEVEVEADPAYDDLRVALVQIGVVPSTAISATWMPPAHAPTFDQHPWTGGMWLVRTISESFAIRYCAEDPFLGSYLPWERHD